MSERNCAVRSSRIFRAPGAGLQHSAVRSRDQEAVIVGAAGTSGRAVVEALGDRHQVVPASHRRSPIAVDIADRASLRRMFETVGRIDAVGCTAEFAPFGGLTGGDLELGLGNKLMKQVNLVRVGLDAAPAGRGVRELAHMSGKCRLSDETLFLTG